MIVVARSVPANAVIGRPAPITRIPGISPPNPSVIAADPNVTWSRINGTIFNHRSRRRRSIIAVPRTNIHSNAEINTRCGED
jgi:hypothetical protein